MNESQISRDLYMLNAERIKYEKICIKASEKKITKEKFKRVSTYLKSGAFSYIADRIEHISKPQVQTNEYNLKDYIYDNKKVVVYMALFGSYDRIYEPLYANKHIDYILITDQKLPYDTIWKVKEPVHFDENLNNRDKNRFYKMLPHRFFEGYDYSIYLDSSYQIVTDLYPLVMDMNGKEVGVHKFPSDSFYKQLNTIWSLNRASKESIESDVSRYKAEGIPDNIGYFWNAVLVRNHTSNVCVRTMEDWWTEYKKSKSKRDQVSFPYVLWKNGFKLDDIVSLGSDIYSNPRLYYRGHLYDDYK